MRTTVPAKSMGGVGYGGGGGYSPGNTWLFTLLSNTLLDPVINKFYLSSHVVLHSLFFKQCSHISELWFLCVVIHGRYPCVSSALSGETGVPCLHSACVFCLVAICWADLPLPDLLLQGHPMSSKTHHRVIVINLWGSMQGRGLRYWDHLFIKGPTYLTIYLGLGHVTSFWDHLPPVRVMMVTLVAIIENPEG